MVVVLQDLEVVEEVEDQMTEVVADPMGVVVEGVVEDLMEAEVAGPTVVAEVEEEDLMVVIEEVDMGEIEGESMETLEIS